MFKQGDWVIAKFRGREILGQVRFKLESMLGMDEQIIYKVDLNDAETGLMFSNLFPENHLTPITKEVAEICLNKAIG